MACCAPGIRYRARCRARRTDGRRRRERDLLHASTHLRRSTAWNWQRRVSRLVGSRARLRLSTDGTSACVVERHRCGGQSGRVRADDRRRSREPARGILAKPFPRRRLDLGWRRDRAADRRYRCRRGLVLTVVESSMKRGLVLFSATLAAACGDVNSFLDNSSGAPMAIEVSGTVTGSGNGMPVPHALLTAPAIPGSTTTAANDGTFTMSVTVSSNSPSLILDVAADGFAPSIVIVPTKPSVASYVRPIALYPMTA